MLSMKPTILSCLPITRTRPFQARPAALKMSKILISINLIYIMNYECLLLIYDHSWGPGLAMDLKDIMLMLLNYTAFSELLLSGPFHDVLRQFVSATRIQKRIYSVYVAPSYLQ